jgi:dihydroorotase
MTPVFGVVGAGPEFPASVGALVEREGLAHLEPVSSAGPLPTSLISPGWIDLHAHVYDGMTSLGVHPDVAGRERGVTVVVDAGSAGEATVDGLVRYVVPSAATRVRAFLNIGSHGLVHLREVADLAWIDVDRTLAAIARHGSFVRGVKVRSSGDIVGPTGLLPLQMARLVAREAGLPLMVHIGEAPPMVDDVVDQLDDGDVVTHCFHGKTGAPWLADGSPNAALRRALERGALLDVGHGRASFSAAVAKRAIMAGWLPNSISTDVHIRNINGPVHSLAVTMTKMLALGMTLEQVVRAVGHGPAKVLREDPWLGHNGLVRRATIFRTTDENINAGTYVDSHGVRVPVSRCVIAEAVIIDGVRFDCPETR